MKLYRELDRFPGICTAAEENPEKPQLVDRLMMVVRPVIVSLPPERLVGSLSTPGREKEGKDRVESEKSALKCLPL
jgi:hypothetical protein